MLIAFPRQQWLCERVSLLRYTNMTCLVGSERKETFRITYRGFVLNGGKGHFCFPKRPNRD